uniref:Chromosome 11 open reading frame 53 n=1 Tax=Varanus komodoensis TaxID=61221 RepID=A0A8D2LPY4_VARKO
MLLIDKAFIIAAQTLTCGCFHASLSPPRPSARLTVSVSPLLTGSAAVSGYGGVRRALMAEPDFQSNKQISGDGYPSSLIAKPLPYDSPVAQSYPPLLDTHFMDQYVNHRTAPASSGSSSLFGTLSLTPIFPSDTAHFSARDAWEHSMTDSLGQADECSEPLQLPSAPGCLSSHEPGEPSHYRSSSWSLPIPGTQSYPFPALEDAHYAAGYSSASPYPFSSFMTTVANELPPKMLQASSEESSDAVLLHDTSSLWTY